MTRPRPALHTPAADFAALIATSGQRIAWAWQQYERDTAAAAQVSLSIVYSELAAAGESL